MYEYELCTNIVVEFLVLVYFVLATYLNLNDCGILQNYSERNLLKFGFAGI